MSNFQFRKSGNTNRLIAFCFTFLFHASIMGALYYSSGEDHSLKDFVPDVIMEWFDDEAEQPSAVEEDRV
ncbi:MAG: hypothetical protein AB8F74_22125 [Saprospiraceae bacterium]